MNNVLVISGHPNLAQSVANQTILQELEQAQIKVRYLDRLYPDFQIDVAAEQAALLAADIIVWQFPLHWYTLPALMKKWLDEVFVYGFAHGSTGNKLQGKKLILSFTTGAAAQEYRSGGAMNFPLDAFLPPLQQTALLCGMEWQPPCYSNGMMYIAGVSGEQALQALQTHAKQHAQALIRQIKALQSA
ncbi:Putative NADPH-quinone reductase (modulator of drug activity B) [Pasteurella testudinis DSM 23072]|uniref:Putative NADPH-quinone reductase (Modulator of drug activity B) n=1 Tax=Pasteurella testudinis DSM 23072 TaxID=1122938 RepID=A0A1W1UH04_9PAST|nr:NAD(P)H-dependent oxidoreductase [Pasteurella testudinis]SMB80054.1 Putative NADPH-quinone reductase (modulator of drug activity B) [Pasteurella testudinis DSM 23072]SUB50609.1 NAD(P)H oxidoreductase [Pasteurella testudinis]